MQNFDNELLNVRLCCAAVDEARKGMLPNIEQQVPNFFILNIHPALQPLYQYWAKLRNLPESVEWMLQQEYGEESSSALLGEQPFRVKIFSTHEQDLSWTLHPDHFFASAHGEIHAHATHINDHDWQKMSQALNSERDVCSELFEAFANEENECLVKDWVEQTLFRPLHVDLHFLYAIALFEEGGLTPLTRPPFNNVAGTLAFIEEHACYYLPLRLLLKGYGNPEYFGKNYIQRALLMIDSFCEPYRDIASRKTSTHIGPLLYWQDVLYILKDLPETIKSGPDQVLHRLNLLDAHYGLRNAAILRFSPLLFAYLWALSATTTTSARQIRWRNKRCLWRIEYENKLRFGKVFANKDLLYASWSDFSRLLPDESFSLHALAAGLLIEEQRLLDLLVAR